ncbi:serine/threonine protein kinase [Stanieria cyanosphaera PCC 7437]|uniref:non-specific serine/threonine protein kinase n=1 Tax=Stanieria cyanosphaera (strain ATCC 29371 / PCC 7437) TaxID=111780 RepID=K9XPI7_STAC7|nr:serine/threonine-protein kinase [Stanieria cyanosphaera]AFZ33966.1 serine/threonine protein kinase [Stanieria cyanosphaera PCC 7437]
MSDPDYTIPVSQSKESHPNLAKIEYGYKILNAGDVIGKRYRIVKELGSGGFATTYLAIDEQSQSPLKCVVKQLQPRFNSPAIWESAKERFATEAVVLQWLGNHDRIPQLLAHFEENQQFYLIQEFIEGEEFEQEIHRLQLSEFELIRFLCDVLEILNFVHHQGVIHRDIKPSNLIRRRSDQKIVLIDFGAVKEIGTLVFDLEKETIQTQIIGTPGYMPPEQHNGKPVYASDIYALGKTAIFALTGRSPLEWEDTEVDDLESWQQRLNVSPQLIAILNRMTRSKVSERYQTVSELLAELKPLLLVETIIEDKYQVINYLGGKRGIYSYVVKDLQQSAQPLYILNLLKLQKIESQTLENVFHRLRQELIHLAKLNHLDRIPKTQEYFISQNHIYLIQEYIEGESLKTIINREFNLDEEEVIDLLENTGEILREIHKHKIIHANIQPSSLIKRSSDGKIVLINFGAIQEITNVFPDSKTGYLPPEQIAGRPITSSDIYALGMTAIYALTGIRPERLAKNPNTGEVIWQQKARVSSELSKILNKMVRLDKQQRYQSIEQVLKALKKFKFKSKIKPWHKYVIIFLSLSMLLFFSRYFWLQYQAILLFKQADLELQYQRYETAIEYYDRGIQKVSGKVNLFQGAWLRKAQALGNLKRYDEMLQTCQEGLQKTNNVYFWNCQGLALEGLKRYDQAIASYNEAIKLKPDFFVPFNNRGEVYTKLGRIDSAVADFQAAVKLSQAESYVPWNNLGKIYFRQQKYEEAINAYQQAIAVKEDYLPALIGLGNTQKALKQYSQALVAYNKAIEVNSDSYEAWFGKGLVEEALQQYREAIKAYEKAIVLKPNWQTGIDALKRAEQKLN